MSVIVTKRGKLPKKNITGQRFGKWCVMRYAGRGSYGQSVFLCKCDCGEVKNVTAYYLTRGRSRSCGCDKKHPPGDPIRWCYFKNYEAGAKKRNYEWDLTYEQFLGFVSANCFYCGRKPSSVYNTTYGSKKISVKFNGIDRRDNTQGYVIGNVTTACKICNLAKHKLTEEEFRSWIWDVYHWMYESA